MTLSMNSQRSTTTDLDHNLRHEKTFLEVATTECVVLIHEQWPGIFRHDEIRCPVANASLHAARTSELCNGSIKAMLTRCDPSPIRQGRATSHKRRVQSRVTACRRT
jgi:hypothetical protein